MAKTYNRAPLSPTRVDYDDTAYKYFGYSTWKGICTDKNFIGVDQETFEDALNVYVDRDGMLRSRPMVVKDHMFDTLLGNIYGTGSHTIEIIDQTVYFSEIVNENIVIHTYDYSTDTISKKIVAPSLPVSETDKLTSCVIGKELWLFCAGNVIGPSVLREGSDIASSPYYIPITKLTSGGTITELESADATTGSYGEAYIWSRQLGTSLSTLHGKYVDVWYGNEPSGELLYQYGVERTLDTTYISSTEGSSIVGSSRGSLLEYTKTTITIGATEYPYIQMWYLVDGVVRTSLSAPEMTTDNIFEIYYDKICFSHDGNQILLPYHRDDGDGVLIRSVINDSSDGQAFAAWTDMRDLSVANTRGESITIGDIIGTNTIASVFMFDSSTYAIGIHNQQSVWVVDGVYRLSLSDVCGEVVCSPTYFALWYQDIGALQGTYIIYTISDNEITKVLKTFEPTSGISTNRTALFLYQGEPYLAILLYLQIGVWIIDKNGNVIRTHSLYSSESDYQEKSITDILFYSPDYGVILDQDGHGVNGGFFINAGIPVQMYSHLNYSENNNKEQLYCIFEKDGEIYYMHGEDTTATHDIYTTELDTGVMFIFYTTSVKNAVTFDKIVVANNNYAISGNALYISTEGAYSTDNSGQWYFPEKNKITFESDIVDVIPLSSSEIGVLLENAVYYISTTTVTLNNVEQTAYTKNKSKIQLGCLRGSNAIVTDDGQYIIYPTKRGIVAMAYQTFVSSTDQTLTFLSTNVDAQLNDWLVSGNIHMLQYRYWYIVYKDDGICWVYDTRNNSWWKMQLPIIPKDCFEYLSTLRLYNGNVFCNLDTADEGYRDLNNEKIGWYLKSQKLHFGAINYYKSVNNIVLSSALDAEPSSTCPFYCNMLITTYRKIMDGTQRPETLSYYIDMTRTFVKQLNYTKLGQFQYELKSTDTLIDDMPLSLTSIVLKYKVTGQVRR